MKFIARPPEVVDTSAAGSVTYLCLQPMYQGQASYAHVREIAQGLRRSGWAVQLVAVPAEGPAGAAVRLWRAAVTQLKLRRQAADLLYVRAHPAALPAAIWARLRRIPVVQELNGSPSDVIAAWPHLRALSALVRASFRWQLGMADAVITVTPGLARWVQREVGIYDISVIPNAADPFRFAPDVQCERPVSGDYVTFFGALAAWQGISTLLAATALPTWPNGVALAVAGDGPARGLVVEASAHDPIRVVYLGTMTYDHIPQLVVHSLAAVIPKEYEAAYGLSPLKLYESMAAGVPVVVTDVPGLAETVRDCGCGLVVPVGDAAAIASAVAALVRDPVSASEMGRRGRERVLAEHTWDHRSRETAALLLRTLKGTERRRSAAGRGAGSSGNASVRVSPMPPVEKT